MPRWRCSWCGRRRRCRGSSRRGWGEMASRAACAVVLAGGESLRFGSDKALARFRGEPLLAHLLRGLCAAGFEQIALAAKEPRKYAAVAEEIAYVQKRPIDLLPAGPPPQPPLARLLPPLRPPRSPPLPP